MSARATPAFRPGMDIQGIPWERAHTTREEYRLQRMREYSLLEMRREPYIYIGEDLCLGEESTPQIFEFTYRNRAFPCTVQHFQLRHLLSSPSLSSVYYTCRLCFMDDVKGYNCRWGDGNGMESHREH